MFKGIILAVIGATSYGFQPVFTKLLINIGVTSNTLLVYRFIYILMIMGIYLIVTKRIVKPTKRQIIDLILYGAIGYGGAIYLLAEAYLYMPMGQATMIHFTYPLFVTLYMVIFYKEKMTWVKAMALGMTCMSILLLMEFNFALNSFGVMIALLSGMAFGAYMVSVSQSSIKEFDACNLMFYLSIVIILVFGIQGVITGDLVLFNLPAAAYGSMFSIALLSIIGIGFMTISIRLIGPTYAAMISIFEPVVTLICGIIFFNEIVTIYSGLGSFLMIAVILLIAFESYLRKIKLERNKIEKRE
ncbi:MAG: DMT family transporter [Eubacterium sp.]